MIGRIFRIVRTPITLLLLLGVLVYGAWWGYKNVIQTVPAAPPDPCVTQTLGKGGLKSSQVVVKVYNGGDRKGLAADVARAIRSSLATELGLQVDQVVLLRAFATRSAQGGTARRRWCRTHHLCRTIAASAWSDGRDRTRPRCDGRAATDGAAHVARVRPVARAD